ncbi:hypothetical protein NL676_006423 [Syzygium grande]|nr:hypothetical protein NL676_006423 [Syzygium grande]
MWLAASSGDVRAHGHEEPEGDREGDRHVGVGGEVVDLVGGDRVDAAAEGGGVGEIGAVKLHRPGLVGVDVDGVDSSGIEVGGAMDQAVDLVPSVEQELGEVRPVLAGNAGDQGHLAVVPRRRGFDVGSGSGSGRAIPGQYGQYGEVGESSGDGDSVLLEDWIYHATARTVHCEPSDEGTL